MKRWTALAAFAALLVARAIAAADFVYPAKGQNAEQQKKDRAECHVWAVDQTGFDPTTASAPPQTVSSTTQRQQTVGSGALLKGGARGAAVGAVGGAIAGDAGKGAAIGAAGGALIGGMRHRDANAPRTTTQTNPAYSEYKNAQSNYQKALKACLTARGYTVE